MSSFSINNSVANDLSRSYIPSIQQTHQTYPVNYPLLQQQLPSIFSPPLHPMQQQLQGNHSFSYLPTAPLNIFPPSFQPIQQSQDAFTIQNGAINDIKWELKVKDCAMNLHIYYERKDFMINIQGFFPIRDINERREMYITQENTHLTPFIFSLMPVLKDLKVHSILQGQWIKNKWELQWEFILSTAQYVSGPGERLPGDAAYVIGDYFAKYKVNYCWKPSGHVLGHTKFVKNNKGEIAYLAGDYEAAGIYKAFRSIPILFQAKSVVFATAKKLTIHGDCNEDLNNIESIIAPEADEVYFNNLPKLKFIVVPDHAIGNIPADKRWNVKQYEEYLKGKHSLVEATEGRDDQPIAQVESATSLGLF